MYGKEPIFRKNQFLVALYDLGTFEEMKIWQQLGAIRISMTTGLHPQPFDAPAA